MQLGIKRDYKAGAKMLDCTQVVDDTATIATVTVLLRSFADCMGAVVEVVFDPHLGKADTDVGNRTLLD